MLQSNWSDGECLRGSGKIGGYRRQWNECFRKRFGRCIGRGRGERIGWRDCAGWDRGKSPEWCQGLRHSACWSDGRSASWYILRDIDPEDDRKIHLDIYLQRDRLCAANRQYDQKDYKK